MSEILTAQRVLDVFAACLCKPGESTERCVKVEGVLTTVYLWPECLVRQREEIEAMLAELPDSFRSPGDTFMNAQYDRYGSRWTQLPGVVDCLFQLGTAIIKLECLVARENWYAFPGGPYYVIK